jgi:hypothetical protein
MTQAVGVDQAFHDLDDAPPALQGLLRPVLIRALQDPKLMRALGTAALSRHLAVLGQVLARPTSDPADSALPPLKTFVHLGVGDDIEDVEDAYVFARSLDAPLRAHVEGGLSRVLQNAATRSGQGTISLCALARLLALAFQNLPFVAHVLDGGVIEPFLPVDVADTPGKQASTLQGLDAAARATRVASPQLASFVGQVVELVATQDATPSGNVFVAIGRVLEVAADHVVIQTFREDDALGAEGHGSKLLIGMAHIVTMRTLSQDSSSDRTSQAG